jgi:DnaJ-class molecular chaperone
MKQQVIKITCPECDGDGVVEVRFSLDRPDNPHIFTCPECEGLGEIDDPDEINS